MVKQGRRRDAEISSSYRKEERTSDTAGKYRRLGVTMDNCAYILKTIYQLFSEKQEVALG